MEGTTGRHWGTAGRHSWSQLEKGLIVQAALIDRQKQVSFLKQGKRTAGSHMGTAGRHRETARRHRWYTSWEWVNPSRLLSFTFRSRSPFWNRERGLQVVIGRTSGRHRDIGLIRPSCSHSPSAAGLLSETRKEDCR
jgi:hypothetical protein